MIIYYFFISQWSFIIYLLISNYLLFIINQWLLIINYLLILSINIIY